MPHRVHKILAPILAALTLFIALTTTVKAQELDAMATFEEKQREIATKLEASTVFLLAMDKNGDCVGMGSGFIVADGYVLTNAHVVNTGKTFYALNTSLKATKATVVKKESHKASGVADFALLRLATPTPLPVLPFNTHVNRMDRVSAWGFPYLITQYDENLESAVKGNLSKVPPVVYTEGTVNAIVRKGKGTSIIHSAAIAAGNSGGPLINSRGEVVGINTWGATDDTEGAFVNAALPADKIVLFLQGCGINPHIIDRSTLGMTEEIMTRQQARLAPKAPELSQPHAPSATPATSRLAPAGLHAMADQISIARTASSAKNDDSTLAQRAKDGDAKAQYQLGYNLFYGENTTVNEAEAFYWLSKSAEQGHAEGIGTLGVMHVLSEDYVDIAKGLPMIEQAAKSEVYFSAILAMMYYEGEGYGVPRDIEKAFYHASRSAEQEFPDAMAVLGMLYFHGEGVERNTAKAYDLAARAVEYKSLLGQSLMAWMFYTGEVVGEDSKKAFVLVQDAAEAGQASAMGLLSVLYYTGDGVAEDNTKALQWAQRASDAGNEFGHFVLGCLYADGQVVPKDRVKAFAYTALALDANVNGTSEIMEILNSEMSDNEKQAGQAAYRAWYAEHGIELL